MIVILSYKLTGLDDCSSISFVTLRSLIQLLEMWKKSINAYPRDLEVLYEKGFQDVFMNSVRYFIVTS